MSAIILAVGDRGSARRRATDLLQDSVPASAADAAHWSGPSAQPDWTLTYRASWVGSPTALGALGVHRDAHVTPSDLSSLLLGQHAKTGEQVRRAEVSLGAVFRDGPRDLDDWFGTAFAPKQWSFDLELPAPRYLMDLWVRVDPGHRAGIEREMIAAADAALQNFSWDAPPAPGPGTETEQAGGFAAIAIVNSPDRLIGSDPALLPASSERLVPGPLELHIVVLGVEGADGRLVTPKGPLALRVLAEIPERTARTLADEGTFFLSFLKRAAAEREARRGWLGWKMEEKQLIHKLRWELDRSPSDGKDQAVEATAHGDWIDTKALDGFRDVFGERRVAQLREFSQPIRMWLEDKPDAWVRARRAELSPPGAELNRGDARRALLLETQRTRLEDRVTAALDERSRLQERADALQHGGALAKIFKPADVKAKIRALEDMAQVESRNADQAAVRIEDIQRRERRLRSDGRDLDGLMNRHAPQIVLAAAYADDHERRRDRYVAIGVKAALDKPPAHIQAMIGPPLDKASTQHTEYQAITREVEQIRRSTEFDRQDNPAKPELPANLERRIDNFRTDRGMEPRAHVQSLGPAVTGIGREPL